MEPGKTTIPKLTIEFVSELIGQNVKSFTIKPGTAPGDNYMSVLYCLKCVLAESKEGKNEVVYAISKNYPSHPLRQYFLNKTNIFWNELNVYKIWIPALKEFQAQHGNRTSLPIVRLLSGEAINFGIGEENKRMVEKYAGRIFNPFDIYILMVDMKNSYGFRTADRKVGLGLEEMTLIMKEYAKIHALSWAYKVKNEITDLSYEFPFFKSEMYPEDFAIFVNMATSYFKSAHDSLTSFIKPDEIMYADAILRLKENMQDVLGIAWDPITSVEILDKLLRVKVDKSEELRKEDAVGWQVLLHGDSWINNLLFRYDPESKEAVEVVLIDLQQMRESCPTTDLAYCIYSGTSPQFRKKHLNEMLKLYADQFMFHCDAFGVEYLPGFNYEALKRRFHRAKLLGAIKSIGQLPLLLKDANEAQDMEKFKADSDMGDIFKSILQSHGGNIIYKERLYGLTKEMYDEGIF